MEPLKPFLKSKYRREMWRHASATLSRIEKTIPVSAAYVVGSFATRKRRPADVDMVLFIKTPRGRKARWSLDVQIVPDNAYGEWFLSDVKKWMKQKYGAKKLAVFRLR